MNLKTIQTKLETASREDIAPILDRKAAEQGPAPTVDYIGFALENISNSIERIDQVIAELQEVRKEALMQQELIKVGVSEWLTDNGIDKLQGDRISSITVLEKKESYSVVISDEEAVINAGYFKMSVDKTMVKNSILSGSDIVGARLEVTYNEPSIKLNKKRAKKDENII